MKRAILNEQYLNGYIINENAPIGSIQIFSGEHIPNGYLECNGQALSKTNYSRLYSVIGDTYGSTETTFNIPDLRDKFVQGARENVGTEKAAGLPNLIGQVGVCGQAPYSDGKLFITIPGQKAMSGNSYLAQDSRFEFNANKYNSIYGNSDTVQPPSICMYYIIKATDYTQATEDILDDSKITTGNVLSAAKVVEMNSYSTEETIIGKWIDGKPIYRKVINTSAKNLYSWQFIPETDNLSIKKIIKAMAMGTDAEYTDCTAFLYARRFPNGKFGFLAINWPIYATTIILEYTKTTK